MPIVSHTYEEIESGPNRIHVIVRPVDQDGREYFFTFDCASTSDVDSIISAKLAAMNVSLAESEFETLVMAD